MSGIFISYRRSDANVALAIGNRLEERYGVSQVFFDVDSIEFGVDFRAAIEHAVATCDVMLAVIGPAWLEPDATGRPRLFDANDYVLMEITTALEHSKPVIPVLVNGAQQLRRDDVPYALMHLANVNAASVGPEYPEEDLLQLEKAIDRFLTAGLRKSEPTSAPPSEPTPQRAQGHDVFISFADEDAVLAEQVVEDLEAKAGPPCWISLRDLPPGSPAWMGPIVEAIASSKLMVVILTSDSLKSLNVLRELTLADDEGIPFLGFHVDDSELTSNFRYFFTTAQRLEVAKFSATDRMARLRTSVAALIG